ncbi:hypothetical protein CASFOL_011754 [Castilleja foliolosa]|uniref:RADIALIS n=1 Tax=Castilleja foliolosa TaxID=1961234 RepID=A0ABD3DQE0_9LAMI
MMHRSLAQLEDGQPEKQEKVRQYWHGRIHSLRTGFTGTR